MLTCYPSGSVKAIGHLLTGKGSWIGLRRNWRPVGQRLPQPRFTAPSILPSGAVPDVADFTLCHAAQGGNVEVLFRYAAAALIELAWRLSDESSGLIMAG